jgi:hypothetical protein
VRLRSLAVFGLGYVLGSKAGRERYGQIIAAANRTSQRLDEYSRETGDGDELVSGSPAKTAGRRDRRPA